MVRIAGAGLAGCAAALSALGEGASARLWDPSRVPRHKVCGEFLTPEIEPVLRELGLWEAFLSAKPAQIRRMSLHFGGRESKSTFPETAFGMSRYRLDCLLRESAANRGAECVGERAPGEVEIVAHGRQTAAGGRKRLFGFKAHFQGPKDDAVELYFFDGFYVGINTVEDGITNVCGLGPEESLRAIQFDYDQLMTRSPALAERLRPLSRSMEWMSTGPLVYRSALAQPPEGPLLAGDALQFVDPFTGTGMSIAIWTGALAGRAAARKSTPDEYYRDVRRGLSRQFQRCGWLRAAMERQWPLRFAPLVPPGLLYRATRPEISVS